MSSGYIVQSILIIILTPLFIGNMQFTNKQIAFSLRKQIGSDDVYQATMKYVDWRVYGFFFSFVAVMFRAFYVGGTKTKILSAFFYLWKGNWRNKKL